MRHFLIAMFLLLGLSAQAQKQEYLTFDNLRRSMIVYTPKELPENAPLVITLHGFNQSAQYQMEHTKWNTVADTAKFVVVYPDYEGGWWDVNGTKDTRFIEHIMNLMHQRHKIDLNRVYISGFSLGAMMTYQCIEKLGNKVAAFAPVSGVRFDNRAPVAPRIVPIIHTHCKGDDVFKWGGDPSHASGGYPYIPDYVKSWAVYEGMDPTPQVIDPYPANKSNSDADLTIYRRDDSIVEVRLLSFDGAGHWHVDADAWGGVSTTSEIWNFCKRYSLDLKEVEPPVLQKVEPENCSFDLPKEQREFRVTFDRPALASNITAKLTGNGQNIELTTDADAGSAGASDVTFRIPQDADLPDGNYTLTLSGVRTPKGDFTRSYSMEYSYGIEETGEELNVQDVFTPDLKALYQKQGEQIPEGWQRVCTKADGTKEAIDSKSNAGSGSRMIDCGDEGDIKTGLYLCATENESCNLNYGRITGDLINLPIGKYVLSLNSAYWDKGSQRQKAKFDVTIVSKTNRGGLKTPLKQLELESSGCLNGTAASILGTKYHEFTFAVDKKDNYVVNLDVSAGKKALFIGNLKITTAPSNADRYKGGFLRQYKRAEDCCKSLLQLLNSSPESFDANQLQQLETLRSTIEKYRGFASTSPSAYSAATQELISACEPLKNLQVSALETITDRTAPSAVKIFSADGREIPSPAPGINIIRKKYENGRTETQKIMR